RDRPGGHQTDHRGTIDLRPEETKRYQHGDPLVLDLVRTLKKALTRRPGTPLDVHPEDFEVHAATHSATSSTVLLLDMSWSMSWGGISMRAAQETLKEVERVTRRGIVINTFMLDDSPSLRAFVERMTRINKGRALYTRPDRLGEYLLVDYIAKKRKRV